MRIGRKYWETIADNVKKAGWSWGCVSAIDTNGRTIWIVDAHRDGKKFIVRANEILTAFLELERVMQGVAKLAPSYRRSPPRNCSHQALPFVEAPAKAKLASS